MNTDEKCIKGKEKALTQNTVQRVSRMQLSAYTTKITITESHQLYAMHQYLGIDYMCNLIKHF